MHGAAAAAYTFTGNPAPRAGVRDDAPERAAAHSLRALRLEDVLALLALAPPSTRSSAAIFSAFIGRTPEREPLARRQ